MDGAPIRLDPGETFEVAGHRFGWEQAGEGIRLIPLPPVVKVIQQQRRGPVLRRAVVERDGGD